jgi:molybdate transport system ATP-binding protein
MLQVNVEKKYNNAFGEFSLSVDIEVNKGVVSCFFGPSGAGKSTALKLITGIIKPDNGEIKLDNNIWFNDKKRINIPIQKRKIGYIFQEESLFPNMTVFQNVKFGSKDNKFVEEIIAEFNLQSLLQRYPHELSGGQRQRVVLARTLAYQPELLLMDEPFSALDYHSKEEIMNYIAFIKNKYHLTIIIISHDLKEVLKIADYLYQFKEGKIIKEGKPVDIFTHNKLSGKLQLYGEIVNIEKKDIIYIVTVYENNTLHKIVVSGNNINNYNVGDKVVIASKAFSPMLIKL